MASCANGHDVPAGAGVCGICGAAAPAAGPPSAAEPDAPVLDYTSGSFADYIAAGEPAGQLGGPGRTPAGHTGTRSAGWAAADVVPPAGGPASPGLADPERGGAPAGPGGALAGPGGGRRRRTVAAGVAVALAAGAIVAALVLPRHPGTGGAARPSPAAVPRGTAPPPSGPAQSPPAGPASSAASAASAARWSAPVPLAALSGGGATVSGLSCPAPGHCYAVDTTGGVLAQDAAGHWPVAVTDPHGSLAAIDCGSARDCLAVDTAGYALILSQGSWSGPVYVDTRAGTLTAVSCASPGFCMAVDSGGNAFAYTGPGGWAPFTVTAGAALNAVSCPRPGTCLAVSAGGYAYTFRGGAWSPGVPVTQGTALTGVSCSNTSFCAAIAAGGQAAVLSGGSGLAGGRWAVATLDSTARAVACPAAGYCVAIDGAGGALTYTGGTWSAVRRIDGTVPGTALSCAGVGSCVAADRSGDVLSYAPPAAG